MTEDDLKLEEIVEEVPTEEVPQDKVEDVPEDTSHEDNYEPTPEEVARDKGWKPKEEFEGDPDTWVDAKEFLAREPLFKAIHKHSRENKRLIEMNKQILKTVENIKKAEYARAVKDLQRKYEIAADNNDIKTAVEIHSQIQELEQEAEQPIVEPTPSQEPAKAFKEWLPNNQWYTSDKQLKRYADGYGSELAAEMLSEKNPGETLTYEEQQEIYNAVAKAVREEFPDKFMNKNRQRPSATVNTPRRTSTTTQQTAKGKTKYKIEDLPEEAQAVAKLSVKSRTNPHGAFESLDEYVDLYLQGGGELVKK